MSGTTVIAGFEADEKQYQAVQNILFRRITDLPPYVSQQGEFMNSQIEGEPNTNTTWLAESIERVLRPLIRIIIGSVTFPAFFELAKKVFVEEAQRKLRRADPDKKPTKSALALLTGIDTRVINQIIAQSTESTEYRPQDMCPESAVLDRWASNKEYRDPKTGQPMDLLIYGRGQSFQTLVTKTVGRNVTPSTVLERLTDSENIQLIDDNTVRLLSHLYFPLRGSKQAKVDSGTHAASNVLRAANHNLRHQNEEELFVQRQMWTLKLPVSRQQEFRQALRELLSKQVMDAEAEIAQFEAEVPGDETTTAGVGYYYWEQDE